MPNKFIGIVFTSLILLLVPFISSQVYAAAIQGKVVKSDGSTALVNADIMLRTNNWSGSNQWVKSGADGTFSFTSLSTETAYIMEFRAPWENPDGLIAPDATSSITFTDNGQTYYRDGSVGTNFDDSSKAVITFTAANNTITGTLTRSNNTAISGAYVEAYKEMGSGWVQATTNASGVYTLKVGAGTWMVTPRANYGGSPQDVDWTYNKTPTRLKFANNNVSTTTLNFTAQSADCAITGTVLDPNGAALSNPQSSVYVSVWSYQGGGNSSNVDSNGAFNLKVPEGSYTIGISSWQGSYGNPADIKFIVTDANSDGTCDGYAAGNIRLVTKNSTIRGRVLDSNGTAVANKTINTWKQNGGWGYATTDVNGDYSILVTAGTWMISMSQDPGMSGSYSGTTYVNNSAPTQVTVADGATTTANFTLQIANATISGRVVNSEGTTLTSLEMGYVYVEDSGVSGGPGPMMYSSMGAPVKNGIFTLKVPAGTYSVGVSLPPGAGYCTGSSSSVTAVVDTTTSATITMTQATGTISGLLKQDSDTGTTITGVRAEIFANSGTTNFAMATVNTTDGTYSMSVCPGDWYVGYWIDPSLTDGESNTYLRQPPSNNKVTISAGALTQTKNIIVKKNDATISGTVKDPDGTGLAGAWVSIDTRSNDTAGSFSRESMFNQGTMTDSSGAYSTKVPSGTTYYVQTFVPPSYSYINPSRVVATPTSGGTSTVDLQFSNADATVTGTVTQDGATKPAFVSGWSEAGGYSGTTASSDGTYTLNVSTGSNWHIKAMYDVSKTSFVRSSESVVTPITGSNTLNLSLSNTGTMPDSTTTTYTATNQKTITLSDGTTINIPAGALASSGTVTVTVTAKAQLPNQSLATPVNIGYDITALDSNGSEITSTFNSNVTIVMPYTEAQLTSLGITENDLLAGYWDTTTNAWKTADNVSIDKDNNTITVTINHFTDFAPFSAGKNSSTSTTTTTSTSTSTTSTGTNKSGNNPVFAEIYAGTASVIKKDQTIVIVEKGAMPWDSYLSVDYYRRSHPKYFNGFWQVTDAYEMWFRSWFNNAKIIKPNKQSIIALKYTKEQLGKLPENSLKIAYSSNEGKSWRTLPTSIIDKANKTVAALSYITGRYMVVGGYGSNNFVESKALITPTEKSEIKEVNREAVKDTGTVGSKPKEIPTPKSENKKSIFQKIIDFIF